MAAGGENGWPYLGRNRWPLTTARLQSVEYRPKHRRMAHYQATLDGIEARYGRSRLSERLREQLERWPER